MGKKITPEPKAKPPLKAEANPKETKPEVEKVAEKPPEPAAKSPEPAPKPVKAAEKPAVVSPTDDDIALFNKIKRKYHQVAEANLVFPDRETMLKQVCTVLGMSRKQLDWVLQDL